MDRQLEWDGERVKETVPTESKKHTPKDILNALDHVRNQINSMEGSLENVEKQLNQTKNNIEDARKFEKELIGFEDKCVELQKEKINIVVNLIRSECKEKALKDAKVTIAKDTTAYTDFQIKQMPYLNYQKLIATDKKMSEKVSNRMIRSFLYENPIFENPFSPESMLELLAELRPVLEVEVNPEEENENSE